ncbi:MAG: NINE protein [Prevotella sp.]|jgi:TM2 domain-containing membrane protein YozV|nr:NINE protein [Prevotella sp.]
MSTQVEDLKTLHDLFKSGVLTEDEYNEQKKKLLDVNPQQSTSQIHEPVGGGQIKTITINKNIFVWVFSFLLGGIGLDRFMRGQVGIGVCKLLFGWLTFGIWCLVDWIIAMIKAYGEAYKNAEDITFINGRYSK